jgi:hypothetical protein
MLKLGGSFEAIDRQREVAALRQRRVAGADLASRDRGGVSSGMVEADSVADEAQTPPAAPPRAESRFPATRRWTRGSWWQLFLQFFAVLLGVILGTATTTWREERGWADIRQRALHGLAAEVAYNRTLLSERVAYYNRVVAGIDAAVAAKGDQATLDDVDAMLGLNPPLFRHAAYEVSFHTGAFARFDFGLAERIAATYAMQDWMLRGVDKSADFVVQRFAAGLAPAELRMVFADWSSMGRMLLRHQEELQGHLPVLDPSRMAVTAPPAATPAAP